MLGVCFNFVYKACRVQSLNKNYKFALEKRKSKKVSAMIGQKRYLSNDIRCHSLKNSAMLHFRKYILKTRLNYFGRAGNSVLFQKILSFTTFIKNYDNGI